MTYASEVLADTPLVFHKLSDASGNFADSSGNGRTATVTGTPTYQVTGAILSDAADKAVTLAGSAYGSIAYAAWMNVASLTCEAWVKGTQTSIRAISDRDPGTGGRPWQFRMEAGGHLEFIRINNAAGSLSAISAISTRLINDGLWHHVVATYDGTTIKLYIDGLADSTAAASGGVQQPTSGPYSIGSSGPGLSGWIGSIDDVAFYGTALSLARVNAHYSASFNAAPVAAPVVTAWAFAAGVRFAFTQVAAAAYYEYRIDGGTATAVTLGQIEMILTSISNAAHTLEVRGCNAAGNGPWSTVVNFTSAAGKFFDSFTRTDVAPGTSTLGTADSGHTYTQSLNLGILTNSVYATAATENLAAVASIGNDVVVEATMTNLSTAQGILFRYRDTSNYFVYQSWANGYEIYRRLGGVFYLYGSYTVTKAVGDVLKVVARGPQIRLYVNGVLIRRLEDAQSLATDVGVGIRIATNGARLDNLYARPAVLADTPEYATSYMDETDTTDLDSIKDDLTGHVYKGRDTKILDTVGAS